MHVLLNQPANVTDAIMAAERAEVALNFNTAGKGRVLFQQNQNRVQNRPQQRTFHPREYGNPNTVPMELGTLNQRGK